MTVGNSRPIAMFMDNTDKECLVKLQALLKKQEDAPQITIEGSEKKKGL